MTLIGTAEDSTKQYQPDQIKSISKRNTIQLLAKDVDETVGVAKHLYYVYTDNNGKQTYLSGYPDFSTSRPTAPFGNIIGKTGDYKPNSPGKDDGSPDYAPSVKLVTYRSSTNNPQEVATNFKLLQAEVKKIQDAKVPYNPKGPNSNSVAMQALSRISQVSDIRTPNVGGIIATNGELLLPGMFAAATKPKPITTPQNPQVRAAERQTANALQKYKNNPSPQNLFDYYKSYARTEKVKLENGVREVGTGVQNAIDGANRAIDNPGQSYKEMVNQNPVTVQPTSTESQEVASSNLNSAQPSTQVITVPSSTALTGTALIGTVPSSTALTGTALINTVPSSTALTGTALINTVPISTALTGTALIGTVPISTALTGTTGSSPTPLTGGSITTPSITTPLTGGSTLALTGGRTQEPNSQQMALS
jgi:hypothetical protein